MAVFKEEIDEFRNIMAEDPRRWIGHARTRPTAEVGAVEDTPAIRKRITNLFSVLPDVVKYWDGGARVMKSTILFELDGPSTVLEVRWVRNAWNSGKTYFLMSIIH